MKKQVKGGRYDVKWQDGERGGWGVRDTVTREIIETHGTLDWATHVARELSRRDAAVVAVRNALSLAYDSDAMARAIVGAVASYQEDYGGAQLTHTFWPRV